MKIAGRESVPGGYMVTIEVENAYTDGTSRFDRTFVAEAAVAGKTIEQVAQAVKDSWDDDPIGQVLGQAVAVPTQTRAVFEDRMVLLYEAWRRWQATRIEAVARALAAPVITALTARENAAWAAYAAAIGAWRAAA